MNVVESTEGQGSACNSGILVFFLEVDEAGVVGVQEVLKFKKSSRMLWQNLLSEHGKVLTTEGIRGGAIFLFD